MEERKWVVLCNFIDAKKKSRWFSALFDSEDEALKFVETSSEKGKLVSGPASIDIFLDVC